TASRAAFLGRKQARLHSTGTREKQVLGSQTVTRDGNKGWKQHAESGEHCDNLVVGKCRCHQDLRERERERREREREMFYRQRETLSSSFPLSAPHPSPPSPRILAPPLV